jgi:hypothetical protein
LLPELRNGSEGVSTPEGAILKLVLDYLSARKIFHRRMNSGAVTASYKGKSRFVRYGSVGMADVLAVAPLAVCTTKSVTLTAAEPTRIFPIPVYWLEVKAPKGKLSEAQEQFRKEVTENGMQYVVVKSLEDLQKAGL